MRYFFALLVILLFVVGCGCANSPMIFPAYGFDGDTADVWPIFFITDNAFVGDNGYMVFYDQETDAWKAPRLIAADLLKLQLTPQRNSIGWRGSKDDAGNPGGVWNVSYIENVTSDLIMMESPDDAWQDDAGAWGLVDNNAGENWQSCDVETRQNFIFALAEDGVPVIDGGYIDLSAGVPNWVFPISTAKATEDHAYSLVLDSTLRGISWGAYDNAGTGVNLFAVYVVPNTTSTPSASGDIPAGQTAYPQVLWSSPTNYVFGTDSNVLIMYVPHLETYDTEDWTELVYTATTLTADYHATWMKFDDTIHVVLIDHTALGNTLIIYLRRDPNGWVEQETLLTADGTFPGTNDSLTWPQICADPIGNIFISYIFIDEFIGDTGRDLQGFYLDAEDYHDPVVGNWVQYTDIDNSAVDIKAAIMPDYGPIPADM